MGRKKKRKGAKREIEPRQEPVAAAESPATVETLAASQPTWTDAFAAMTLVDLFHKLYYDARERTWTNTRWLGHHVLKNPLDLWVYQEILHELRPGLIVETGTWAGGSALFLAGICDLLGHGRVVSIDINPSPALSHPRITWFTGSSTDAATREAVAAFAALATGPVLVILDSDHTRDHVLAEMRSFAPFVTPGSYLIVEDTNVNGHPVSPEHGPGPMEAVEQFLAECPDFAPDRTREKFFLTQNPGGYLRRR